MCEARSRSFAAPGASADVTAFESRSNGSSAFSSPRNFFFCGAGTPLTVSKGRRRSGLRMRAGMAQ